MSQTDKLLSTRKVCELLNVTPSGVSRMVKRGAITPAVVVQAGHRGAFLFDRATVEALASERAARRKAAA